MIHYNASSDNLPVSYNDSIAYATARGGRLATLAEVQYYLESDCTLYCTKPDCADGLFGVDQWVAVTIPRTNDADEVNGGKDWVQVGIGFGNDMGLSLRGGASRGNLAGLRFHSSFVWITSSSPPPQPPALPPLPLSPPSPPELPPALYIFKFQLTLAGEVADFLENYMGPYQALRTLGIARLCMLSLHARTHRHSHTHTHHCSFGAYQVQLVNALDCNDPYCDVNLTVSAGSVPHSPRCTHKRVAYKPMHPDCSPMHPTCHMLCI